MKCIIRKGSTAVERVSNQKAAELVVEKSAVYCPKWVWKEQRGVSASGRLLLPIRIQNMVDDLI